MNDVGVLLLLVPILVIQVGLVVLGLRDLLRPERRVRGDNKLAWGAVIVFLNIVGPIMYFVAGRREE